MRFTHLRQAFALAFLAIALPLAVPGQAHAQDETQPCDPEGQLIAYGDVRAGCTLEVVADLDIFTLAAAAGVMARSQPVYSATVAACKAQSPAWRSSGGRASSEA